jgi:hypothetical protein
MFATVGFLTLADEALLGASPAAYAAAAACALVDGARS